MSVEQLEQEIKVLQREYDYFKKRYNEEKNQAKKDYFWTLGMMAEAAIKFDKEKCDSLRPKKMGEQDE